MKKETRGRKRSLPVDKLKKLIPILPDKEVAKLTGLKLSQVRGYAGSKKIIKKIRFWSSEEEKIILQYYPNGVKATIEALVDAGYERRTRWAVINKKRELTKK